ncbi:hypothetical protein [Powai lake megavirus]|uniref:Uncharacterized protein n=1 Tax=Powai lake megavirus TaxID=1842663 RepID=A0A167R3D5_9VIRU|nr:hypothetical protein QJ849_gp105 [Powai lake megavirus]ANB50267.1 hypothetical protein [Powai lake megavirus]
MQIIATNNIMSKKISRRTESSVYNNRKRQNIDNMKNNIDNIMKRTKNLQIMMGGNNKSVSQNKSVSNKSISNNNLTPKVITVILEPHLLYNGNESTGSYLTGIDKIDKIIEQRISQDYTDVKNVFQYTLKYTNKPDFSEIECIDYKFKDGSIYLKLKKKNNTNFTKDDYDKMHEDLDNGADGWMEGDITIYEGDDLKETGLTFEDDQYSVELGLGITDILPHL